MSWLDVLLLHWPVDQAALEPHLPPGLELDTYEGQAWLTITPLLMRRVGMRASPWLPPFAELNLRTYVTAHDKPGILFFSLHAPDPLIVAGGKALGLPYRLARTRLRREGRRRRFASRAGHETFAASYEPRSGDVDDLDVWLAQRYCMYSRSRRRLLRTQVQHRPWPLQPVDVEWSSTGMLERFGAHGRPRASFSPGVDVVLWPPERVEAADEGL